MADFNYVNRVAEGLGVELEEHWDEDARCAAAAALGREASPALVRDSLAP